MSENERIKIIRKKLNMTAESFGKKIGVTRAAISNIENGNRSVTDQMRKSICREFNVDYIWLTTGEGEPFFESDESLEGNELLNDLLQDESEFVKSVFKMFNQKYTAQDWKKLFDIMNKSAGYLQEISKENKKE